MIQSMTSGSSSSRSWRSTRLSFSCLTSSRVIVPQVVVGQRLEHDDLVDAVDELGVEGLLHLAEHHVVDALG